MVESPDLNAEPTSSVMATRRNSWLVMLV